jgi:hypothetical protein
MKTKIQIGGITIKDDDGTPDLKLLVNYQYEKTASNKVGEAILNVPRQTNDTIALTVGKVIEIWRGETTSTDEKAFSGYISEVNPKGGLIEIVARDKLWDLVRKNVNKFYDSSIDASAGQISAIAEDLIETYGGLTASVVATGTDPEDLISQFRCSNTDIWERLLVLAKAVDYQIRYNPHTDLVYFEPRGNTDSTKTISVGNQIMNVPNWVYDTSQMINDLRVDGATTLTQITETGQIGVTAGYTTDDILLTKTPEIVELFIDAANPPTTQRQGGSKDASSGNYYYVDKENKKVIPATGSSFSANDYAIINYVWSAPSPIHQRNQASINLYGVFQKQVSLTDIKSTNDAKARALEILSRFSIPFVSGKLTLRNTTSLNLDVGQLVTVVDNISKPSVNRQMVINKRLIKYPGNIEELSVGDDRWDLEEWSMQTEERLKRLEEQNQTNDDLLTELLDIQIGAADNLKKPNFRYIQIQTRDTSTDSLWDREVWDTDNWDDGYDNSMVDNFIMQSGNTFLENFKDTKFKGTNTTATWTSTGSATFTAGQLIESKSIDFGNGTITAATFTFTELSGTFSYEATADGTNWESVTSGVAHNFTNTGSDLRFRATESGASTGEISQVTATSYH